MNWSQFFTSSVGKKLTMALSGIFLVVFLLVHAGLNACIWANDNGEMFNAAAHYMGHHWAIRLLEVGLFAFFIIHIIQGLKLEAQNRSKRGQVAYAVKLGNRGSKWYSRSMGILGILILFFLVAHLAHFWVPTRANQGWIGLQEIEPHNPFQEMKTVFSSPLWVSVYVLGVVALFWHLVHGIQSAFRTLGVTNQKHIGMLTCAGWAFAVVVCVAFIVMPFSFYFGWVG